jgi:MFS transporter, DHA1 family, multidrug resistance protein
VVTTTTDERRHVLEQRTRRTAGVVLFLSFVDVFALLPTVGPHVTALGGGPAAIGLAVGAYSAANLPANIVGGILVDRWGRRRVLLLGLGLATLAVAAYALAGTVAAFLLTRMLHGIAGGILIPAVFAAAGDRADPGRTGRSFGRLGALIGAAAVLAPAAAGIVRQTVSTEAVFLGVAALLALGFLVAAWGVHDHLVSPSAAGRHVVVPGAMRALLADPTLRRTLIATVTLTAAVGILAGFLPGVAESLGAEPGAVGGLFTAYGIVAVIVMLSPLAGRVDRGYALSAAAVGLGILALSLTLLTVAGAFWVAVVASAVFGAGYGLLFPAVTATTSLLATETTRGRAFGLFNMAFSLGLAVGPPLIGWAAEVAPRLDAFLPTAVLCAAVAIWLGVASRDPGPSTIEAFGP